MPRKEVMESQAAQYYSRDFQFWKSYKERLQSAPIPDLAPNPYMCGLETNSVRRAAAPTTGAVQGSEAAAVIASYESKLLANGGAAHSSVISGLTPPLKGAAMGAPSTSEHHFEMHRRLIELAKIRQEVNGHLTGMEDRKVTLHEQKISHQNRIIAALNARVQAISGTLDAQRMEYMDYLKALDGLSQVRRAFMCLRVALRARNVALEPCGV